MSKIAMQVEGDTDDKNARSLVRAMLEVELAEKPVAPGLPLATATPEVPP